MSEVSNTTSHAIRPSEWPAAKTASQLRETPTEKGDLPRQVRLAKLADGRWVVSPNTRPLGADEDGLTLTIDRELERLQPRLSKGEFSQLFREISANGKCLETLIVWRFRGRLILLDGHNRLWICLALVAAQRSIPFMIEFRDLPDREAARSAVRAAQAARRNLSDMAAAYFRGKEYLARKGIRGGDRKSKSKGHIVTCGALSNTAQKLAVEHGVTARTIKRNGQLAVAVDVVVEQCGERARDAIMARDGHIKRNHVRWLATLEVSEMRNAMDEYYGNGRFPKRTEDEVEDADMVTLRIEPIALGAGQLFQRLGAKRTSLFIDELVKLRARGDESQGGTGASLTLCPSHQTNDTNDQLGLTHRGIADALPQPPNA